MAHSVLIGGTAYGIKGGKCLVDGTEYSIKRGIGLIDGTQVEYKFTVEPEFIIYSVSDWNTFVGTASNFSAGELVRLGSDIDLSGITTKTIEFSGNFDGNGHIISNLKLEKRGDTCSLFYALEAQIVANLTLNNLTVEDNTADYAAVLCGSANAETIVQNVHVIESKVYAKHRGAGLIGNIIGSKLIYCSVVNTSIRVVGESIVETKTNCAGGMAAYANDGTFEDCYSKNMDLTRENSIAYIGGILGYSYTSQDLIERCWTTYQDISGNYNAGTAQNCFYSVKALSPTKSMFISKGYTENIWNIANGYNTTLNPKSISYIF